MRVAKFSSNVDRYDQPSCVLMYLMHQSPTTARSGVLLRTMRDEVELVSAHRLVCQPVADKLGVHVAKSALQYQEQVDQPRIAGSHSRSRPDIKSADRRQLAINR